MKALNRFTAITLCAVMLFCACISLFSCENTDKDGIAGTYTIEIIGFAETLKSENELLLDSAMFFVGLSDSSAAKILHLLYSNYLDKFFELDMKLYATLKLNKDGTFSLYIDMGEAVDFICEFYDKGGAGMMDDLSKLFDGDMNLDTIMEFSEKVGVTGKYTCKDGNFTITDMDVAGVIKGLNLSLSTTEQSEKNLTLKINADALKEDVKAYLGTDIFVIDMVLDGIRIPELKFKKV